MTMYGRAIGTRYIRRLQLAENTRAKLVELRYKSTPDILEKRIA